MPTCSVCEGSLKRNDVTRPCPCCNKAFHLECTGLTSIEYSKVFIGIPCTACMQLRINIASLKAQLDRERRRWKKNHALCEADRRRRRDTNELFTDITKDSSNNNSGLIDELSTKITTLQGVNYLHSERNPFVRLTFFILLITGFVLMTYQLYERLGNFVANPIFIEVDQMQIAENASFPDLLVCSSMQVRWSKLIEMHPFNTLEFVRLMGETDIGGIDTKSSYYDACDKAYKSGRLDYTGGVNCKHREDYFYSVFFTEKGLDGPVRMPRFSRHLFKSDGMYNLDFLHNPTTYEEYSERLRAFAVKYQVHYGLEGKYLENQYPYVRMNRTLIAEHFLGSEFDYVKFRQVVAGEHDELVAACSFGGKPCQTNITKIWSGDKICFRLDGREFSRSQHSKSSPSLNLLIDTHGLDLIEEIQNVVVDVGFLSSGDNKEALQTERVSLLPSTYTRVVLEPARQERTAKCGSIPLQLYKTYSEENCKAESSAETTIQYCECVPSFLGSADVKLDTKLRKRQTTEDFFCYYANYKPIVNADISRCISDCSRSGFSVLQAMGGTLHDHELTEFPNLDWTPRELTAFKKHFNVHHPVLREVDKLFKLPFRKTMDMFSKNRCENDPGITYSNGTSSAHLQITKIRSEVNGFMSRERNRLVKDLLTRVLKSSAKEGTEIGSTWPTTTAQNLTQHYVQLLNQTSLQISPCLTKAIENNIEDLLTEWVLNYTYNVENLKQFTSGTEYNRNNMLRLDIHMGSMTEKVTRYHGHNLWTFFSEVGGTMGLYLGATFITIFEVLVLFWEKFMI